MKNRIFSMILLATLLAMTVTTAQGLAPGSTSAWVKDPGNPLFTPQLSWETVWQGFHRPAVVWDGAQYHMWYTAYGGIGYATSPDGKTWTRQSQHPVITGEGEPVVAIPCSTPMVGWPAVIRDGSQWKMWYTAACVWGMYAFRYQIHYASSLDGIVWKKYEKNPVLIPTPEGWDYMAVHSPTVIYKDGIYRMWYQGSNGFRVYFADIGYATSLDGINWTKSDQNPVLRRGEYPAWDFIGKGLPSVLYRNGSYHLWYSGWGYGSGVGHAVSPDGIQWADDGSPVLVPGPSGNSDDFYYGFAVVDNQRLRMWYAFKTGIGLADEITLEINHLSGKPGSFFKLTATNFPPGKPAAVSVNGKVFTPTITPSPGGEAVFLLETASADPGHYVLSLTSVESPQYSLSLSFDLLADGILQPKEGEGIQYTLPEGIAYTHTQYLPVMQIDPWQ